jgi:hypothetical protein
MIEKKEIEKLGYNLKSELKYNTLDFVIQDDSLPHMINLAEGKISTIPAMTSTETQKIFSEISDFIEYYSK